VAARAGGEAALAVSHSAARVGGSPLPCARHFLWGTFLLGGKRENKKTAADNTLIHYTCPPVGSGGPPPTGLADVGCSPPARRRGTGELGVGDCGGYSFTISLRKKKVEREVGGRGIRERKVQKRAEKRVSAREKSTCP